MKPSACARHRVPVLPIALSIAVGAVAAPARAETVPSDARSLGLAGATTALVDGPYLQLYNPAAITQEKRISLFFPLLVPSLATRTYNSVGSVDDLTELVQSFVSPTSSRRTSFPDLSNGFTISGSAVTPALGFSSGGLWGPFSVAFGIWGKGTALLTGKATEDATAFFTSVNTLASGFTKLAGGGFSSTDVSKIDQELISMDRTAGNLLTADQSINGNGFADGHVTVGLTFAYSAAGALGLPFEIAFGTTAKIFINPLTSTSFTNPIDASQRSIRAPIGYNVTAATSGGQVAQAKIDQLRQGIATVRTQLTNVDRNDPNSVQRLNDALVDLSNKATDAVSAKTFTLSGDFVTDVPGIGFGMDVGVQANMAGHMLSTGIALENVFVNWPAKRVVTTKVFKSSNSFNPAPGTPDLTTTVTNVNYDASEPRAFKWGVAYFPNLGDTVVALDVHKTFNKVDPTVRLGAEFGILSALSNKEGNNNLRAGSTDRIPLDFSIRTGLEMGGGAGTTWLFGFGIRYEGIRILDLAFTPIEVARANQARSLAAGLAVGSTWQF